MELKRISFVVTSRNDGETNDELVRIQVFVASLLEQCDRFDLDAELIIVEWNPPSQRLPLAEALRWPEKLAPCSVRVIRVSEEIHRRFKNSEIIPLFQMIAKNVGIRRARGRFVLATNIDILFSDELMQFLASGQLNSDRMYRVDRYDVPATIPTNLTHREQLEWCKQNVLRVYRYLETVPVANGRAHPRHPLNSSPLEKISAWLLRRKMPLHTNACGDFTLLSAEYWMKLAGNPEFPLRAMKLDGLLCYAAHYAGAREHVLGDPMRIYHLEHPPRADGALVALSGRRSESPSLQVSLAQYQIWVNQMRRTRRPIIFNKHRWGLADDDLPETVIG